MSYGIFGENRVSLPHSDRTSRLGYVRLPCNDKPYVRSRHRTSIVWVLRENFIFSPLSAYSPTPKATRNYLKLSSPVYNFHAT
jgi:hypothetical protein